MKKTTFAELIKKMTDVPRAVNPALVEGLTKAAVQVHKTAVSKFGTYQPAVGPFPAWQELTIQTVNRKMDYGGASGPNPLIGAYGSNEKNKVYPVPLRQSITMHVDEQKLVAQVGTNDPLGLWHEFGSSRWAVHYPPRPFLRPALYENEDWIRNVMRESVGVGLMEVLKS